MGFEALAPFVAGAIDGSGNPADSLGGGGVPGLSSSATSSASGQLRTGDINFAPTVAAPSVFSFSDPAISSNIPLLAIAAVAALAIKGK